MPELTRGPDQKPSRPNLRPALSVVEFDVIPERFRQMQKWGVQSHEDGTGGASYLFFADHYKELNDAGPTPWSIILLEEVYEALSETDPERLREELVQVAAVAVAWIEDIDRRQFARVLETEQLSLLEAEAAIPEGVSA